MGDQRVKPLWDANAAPAEHPLRRPNRSSTPNSMTNSTNIHDSRQSLDLSRSLNNSVRLDDDDILSKSTLSVDAKEWFPPNYNQAVTPDFNPGSTSRSVQNRLLKYKLPSETAAGDGPMENFPQPHHDGVSFDEAENDLSKLEVIIYTLIEDPGQFDSLIGTFIETLGPYYEDVNVVSTTTDLIFSQALQEANFRYNAARLCSTIDEQCPFFRSALPLLCEKKIKENAYDASLALFLAELYAQLNYDNLYGRFVIQSLQAVVSFADGYNVKSVCQVLKLTGSSLESYNKQAINEIFERLVVVKEVVPNNIVNLINSVVTLRSTNWGQGQTSPTSTNNRYQNQEVEVHDGPIFYGPDGKELTDEERQFLSDNCSYQSDFITDDSDPDGLWDPDPEMDEEMQAAFRQFVQSNK